MIKEATDAGAAYASTWTGHGPGDGRTADPLGALLRSAGLADDPGANTGAAGAAARFGRAARWRAGAGDRLRHGGGDVARRPAGGAGRPGRRYRPRARNDRRGPAQSAPRA